MTTVRELAAGIRETEANLRTTSAAVASGDAFDTFAWTTRTRSRIVRKPDPSLMFILKKASEYLYETCHRPSAQVFGFVKGRSTVQNAARHLDRDAVLRLDLEAFFDSISFQLVQSSLLNNGFDADAAALLATLVTVDDSLPTGFPTSPVISNLVFASTDSVLAAWAADVGLNYTRYVDDLTFSGAVPENARVQLESILDSEGWAVNESKTLLMKRGGKQYVTGLSVSDPHSPRLPRPWKKRLRFKVHIIEKFGYESYWNEFGGEDLNDYPRRLIGMARHAAGIEKKFGGEMLRRLDAALSDIPSVERNDDDWEAWLAGLF